MAKARARIPLYVQGADAKPFAGASVYVRTDPGGADAVIYSSRTGAGTLPNPAPTTADGRVAGYLERGDYVATVSGVTGIAAYPEAFEAAPGKDGAIDDAWIASGAAAAGLVAVRQADGAIAWQKVGAAGVADDAIGSAQLADDGVLAQHIAAGQVGLAELAAEVLANFVKTGGVDLRIATGSFVSGYASTNSNQDATITHGLGRVPLAMIVTQDRRSAHGDSSGGSGGVRSWTTTQATIRTSLWWTSYAFNINVGWLWAAIG